jgi:hypothetical protein
MTRPSQGADSQGQFRLGRPGHGDGGLTLSAVATIHPGFRDGQPMGNNRTVSREGLQHGRDGCMPLCPMGEVRLSPG